MMSEYAQIVLRLTVATLIGATIGLNRGLHHKPTGLRTLALVGLGAAMVIMAGPYAAQHGEDFNGTSRIIQGVITGIGFLGAGVILRGHKDQKVSGFTTATTIWLTAAFGIMAGLGAWPALIIALCLTWSVLMIGGPVERWFNKRFALKSDPPE